MRFLVAFLILSQVAFGYHHPKYAKGLKRKSNIFLQSEMQVSFTGVNVSIPNEFSLIPQLSQVEDQGQCGSCWDFSLTDTLRNTYITTGLKDPGRLSFMYLLNCAKDMSGCNGGDFDAAKYMIDKMGPPLYNFQPYTAHQTSCKKGPVAASGVAYRMLGSASGPSFKDIAYVISQLKKPLATEVAADDGFQNYQSGVYSNCSSTSIDHMVELVGYSCEGKCDFDLAGNLPNGVGYYIIKNSWGPGWGEKGYIRIKATNKKGKRCDAIATEALYYDLTLPKQVDVPTPFLFKVLEMLKAALDFFTFSF